MTKYIKYIILFIFVFISMFFTNEMFISYRENDSIMKNIKDSCAKYNIKPQDALIINDDIISGSYGREVNINKSYSKMKRYGSYNELMTVFSTIKPNISIDNNYNKYLIKGNGKNREVALVFIIKNNKKIEEIKNLLKKKNVSATFFIDGLLLENNNFSNINDIQLELLNYDGKIDEVFFKTSLSYLSSITGVKPKYCFTEKNNSLLLDLCSREGLHTIKANVYKNIYNDVKNNLENSLIIPIDNFSIKELSSTIDYVRKKGYSFVLINDLFRERDT